MAAVRQRGGTRAGGGPAPGGSLAGSPLGQRELRVQPARGPGGTLHAFVSGGIAPIGSGRSDPGGAEEIVLVERSERATRGRFLHFVSKVGFAILLGAPQQNFSHDSIMEIFV